MRGDWWLEVLGEGVLGSFCFMGTELLFGAMTNLGNSGDAGATLCMPLMPLMFKMASFYLKFFKEWKKKRKNLQWDVLHSADLSKGISGRSQGLGYSLQHPDEVGHVFPWLSKGMNLRVPSERGAQILASALLFIAARPRGANQGHHTGARLGLTLTGVCGFWGPSVLCPRDWIWK